MTRISRQIRKQKNRNPKGYRHKDEVIENYALIAWIIGGQRHYEILNENFKPASSFAKLFTHQVAKVLYSIARRTT
jgi:hypothetical protein